MNNKELIFSLRAILLGKDVESMLTLLKHHHPADIAAFLPSFADDEIRGLFLLMPVSVRAEVFGYFSLERQVDLASGLSIKELAELILAMSNDERADLFNQLPDTLQKQLMPGMAKAEREDICKLASYEEGKVGSIMTSDYALLDADMSAEQGIARLRRSGSEKETIYQAYVVNGERQLVGTVSLRDLIMAEPDEVIESFMTLDPLFARADAPAEIAAQMIAKYDLMALPVINGGDKLVGIVTYDDAMDVASEKADLDFRKVGAVGELVGGLKEASIRLLYRKRVFWLVLLVFGNIFSGAGIAYFEDTITAYVALVFFLPLLVDSGGNAGSQSATLMVRAMATGDVVMRDWAGMLMRELAVAGLLGATMAVAVSVLGIWRGGMEIALVVALTMQLVVVVGSIIGMSLPFLLSRLKFDPATASAPLITSIADAVGVVIYFSIATLLLDLPSPI